MQIKPRGIWLVSWEWLLTITITPKWILLQGILRCRLSNYIFLVNWPFMLPHNFLWYKGKDSSTTDTRDEIILGGDLCGIFRVGFMWSYVIWPVLRDHLLEKQTGYIKGVIGENMWLSEQVWLSNWICTKDLLLDVAISPKRPIILVALHRFCPAPIFLDVCHHFKGNSRGGFLLYMSLMITATMNTVWVYIPSLLRFIYFS